VFQFCILGAMLSTAGYYLFVKLILPDHRPTLTQMLLFGEVGAVIGKIALTVSYPLMYEYIPRDKLGTASAGMAIFRGVFSFLFGSVMGLFITSYSQLFMPHAGSELMVVFKHPVSEQSLVQMLGTAAKAHPELSTIAPDQVVRKPWFPPGHWSEASNAWNLRIADPVSEQMKTGRDRDEFDRQRLTADITTARALGQTYDNLQKQTAELSEKLKQADSTIQQRANGFKNQVIQATGSDLVVDGEQISSLHWIDGKTLQISLLTVDPPEPKLLEAVARELRSKVYIANLDIRPDGTSGITAHVVFNDLLDPTTAPKLARPVLNRFAQLDAQTASSPALAAAVATLYEDILVTGAGNRVRVAEPFPLVRYAPQQYDYFAGNLLTLFGGFGALVITFVIARFEKSGRVKRQALLEDSAAPLIPDELAPPHALAITEGL
jgi:hypothetical protein